MQTSGAIQTPFTQDVQTPSVQIYPFQPGVHEQVFGPVQVPCTHKGAHTGTLQS